VTNPALNPLLGMDLDALRDLSASARRAIAIQDAREHLIPFTRLMMPDPNDPGNPEESRYRVAGHHRLMADILERVERGKCLRAALSIPPQHGKTQLFSKMAIAWGVGRNPRLNWIFGTYNEGYAAKVGGAVREIMRSKPFRQVFPEVRLKTGSQSKTELEIEGGGQLNFLGRGGSGTGFPADRIVIDDPLKNAEEAESPTVLEELHEWYSKVIYTRARNTTSISIIHTRWAEDDLIGRHCDPDHPDRIRLPDGSISDRDESRRWEYINVPAVVKDADLAAALGLTLAVPTDADVIEQFGAQPMSALWPEEFSLPHLASAKRINPRGFAALYEGKPAPDDGDYFKADWLKVHTQPTDYPRPSELRFYAASDHALSKGTRSDRTCMGNVGIDRHDDIWIMPELVWRKMDADETLNEMIALMKLRKPLMWFAEDEHINKTLGPFRRKRMREEHTYTTVVGLPSSVDLIARARSMQGRLSMGMVHFPGWMPWWQEARSEVLKFPHAMHDDFVSFLSLVGRGLDMEVAASAPAEDDRKVIPFPTGSIQWMKARSKIEAENRATAGKRW